MTMTSYRALTITLFRSQLREPVGLFFSLIFAPLLVLILGLIFDTGPDPVFGGRSFIEATLPAFPSLVLATIGVVMRSEEHTSELQSRFDLVCRLLLEKNNFLINLFSL